MPPVDALKVEALDVWQMAGKSGSRGRNLRVGDAARK